MQRCFRRGLPARLLLLAEFAIEARKGDLTLSLGALLCGFHYRLSLLLRVQL